MPKTAIEMRLTPVSLVADDFLSAAVAPANPAWSTDPIACCPSATETLLCVAMLSSFLVLEARRKAVRIPLLMNGEQVSRIFLVFF